MHLWKFLSLTSHYSDHMGENAHTSHFNNIAQYSNYPAIINPNNPKYNLRIQLFVP